MRAFLVAVFLLIVAVSAFNVPGKQYLNHITTKFYNERVCLDSIQALLVPPE